mmetsp:Transcript_16209/g.54331  ORF Transcript_16209/g.54331 Transcript_16209/m.54331 type:complete len:210 (-) Transcript_16209:664-1293(-)
MVRDVREVALGGELFSRPPLVVFDLAQIPSSLLRQQLDCPEVAPASRVVQARLAAVGPHEEDIERDALAEEEDNVLLPVVSSKVDACSSALVLLSDQLVPVGEAQQELHALQLPVLARVHQGSLLLVVSMRWVPVPLDQQAQAVRVPVPSRQQQRGVAMLVDEVDVAAGIQQEFSQPRISLRACVHERRLFVVPERLVDDVVPEVPEEL